MTAENPRKAPASDYDTFVNWDARLARETPFFQSVFEEREEGRAMDVRVGPDELDLQGWSASCCPVSYPLNCREGDSRPAGWQRWLLQRVASSPIC